MRERQPHAMQVPVESCLTGFMMIWRLSEMHLRCWQLPALTINTEVLTSPPSCSSMSTNGLRPLAPQRPPHLIVTCFPLISLWCPPSPFPPFHARSATVHERSYGHTRLPLCACNIANRHSENGEAGKALKGMKSGRAWPGGA